jgi:hypothetical protein
MSLPDEHAAALRDDVVAHERRITQLRAGIRLAEDEIELHEVILDLARNEQLIAAVGELYESSGLTSKFASDPQRHCEEQKITLPEGVTLTAIAGEAPSPRLTARVRRGAWDMEIVWERDVGFVVRPALPPEPRFTNVEVSAEAG